MRLGFIIAFAAGACFAQQAFAQPTSAEKRGKELIDQAVQALGGEKFLKMEDRVEIGRAYSFYREQISGLSIAKIYTRYLTVAPSESGEKVAQRERESFGKAEDTGVLFNESGGWEITWKGAKELEKDRLERYRRTTLHNILYIFRQRLHEPGMIFESRGADIVENQPVDIVDLTDSQNRVIKVYFTQSTHLPLKQVYRHINAQDKQQDEEVTFFSRYREVNGVQWPYQMRRERNGEKIFEMFADSVAINQDLTDDLFSLPAAGDKNPAKTKKKK
jgi:hypothetical protein